MRGVKTKVTENQFSSKTNHSLTDLNKPASTEILAHCLGSLVSAEVRSDYIDLYDLVQLLQAAPALHLRNICMQHGIDVHGDKLEIRFDLSQDPTVPADLLFLQQDMHKSTRHVYHYMNASSLEDVTPMLSLIASLPCMKGVTRCHFQHLCFCWDIGTISAGLT